MGEPEKKVRKRRESIEMPFKDAEDKERWETVHAASGNRTNSETIRDLVMARYSELVSPTVELSGSDPEHASLLEHVCSKWPNLSAEDAVFHLIRQDALRTKELDGRYGMQQVSVELLLMLMESLVGERPDMAEVKERVRSRMLEDKEV